MALYGNTWVQDSEPTTGVTACQQWIQPTSGAIAYRDTTNSVWTPFGNINNNLGGAVSVSGDTMTGPLLDAPNLPPLDSPNFLGTIDQDGFPVALQINLAALQKQIYSQLATQVRQQFLSQFQQSGTAANIAAYNITTEINQTILATTGLAIDLPVFASDGVTATEAQLLFYGWSVVGGPGIDGTHSDAYWTILETAPGSRLLKLSGNRLQPPDFYINTWAFAVR